LNALQNVKAQRRDFLMVGRRWDLEVTQPLDFTNEDWENRITGLARLEGYQRFFHNIDYFAFRRGLYAKIPPLVIGRIYWDHWVVGKARDLGATVVDVSDVVCAVHQNHDYGYHPKGMEGVWKDLEAHRNLELMRMDTKPATIEDAAYRLTSRGLETNRFYWMAPVKRRWRIVSRKVRGAVRSAMWHPFLDATRRLRHALGLKSAPAGLRNRERRHWMDE
jgi:hypothetical protein